MLKRLSSLLIVLLCTTLASAQSLQAYDYWIDSDYSGHKVVSTSNDVISFSLPVGEMNTGVHFLNFRAQANDGEWGPLSRHMFIVPEPMSKNATATKMEYWFDNDHAARQQLSLSGNEISQQIDVSKLSDGVHWLNLRLQNSDGVWSSITRHFLFCPGNEYGGSPIVAYEYKFNDQSTRVDLREEQMEYTVSGLQLDLPDPMLTGSLEEGCTFTFQEAKDSILLSRKAHMSFTITFQNKIGNWSSPAAHSFDLTDKLQRPAPMLALRQPVNFKKFTAGDFAAFQIQPDKPLGYYLSASQPCKVVIYKADGSRVATIEPEQLASAYQVIMEPGTYYGIAYQTVKDEQHPDETVTIRMTEHEHYVPEPVISYQNETVSITCPMKEATILYSIDGSEPSTVYTEPFSLKHNAVIKATATYPDYDTSGIVSYKVNSYQVAKPTITFANLKVSIATATEGASIYYTLDGTDPTSASNKYTEPLALTQNTTIHAIGIKANFRDSEIATYQLDVTDVKCAVPVFSREGDTLRVACETAGATIYYTTDGTMPTTQSTRYEDHVVLERNCTVRAIAAKEGFITSEVSEAYTVDWLRVAKPVLTYNDSLLTISCATKGATIYYTMDGKEPTRKSDVYQSPVFIDGNMTVKAFAVADGLLDSETDSITTNEFKCALPVIAFSNDTVTITCATKDATIYYVINGDTPTDVYNDPIFIPNPCTVKAMAKKEKYISSGIVSLQIEQCAQPTFSHEGNTVYISCQTANADIYYTLDNSEPIAGKSNHYEGKVVVERNYTLKAIAVKEGMLRSAVGELKIDWLRTEKPVISLVDGLITISCEIKDAIIRYTIDNPDFTNATVYTQPFPIDGNHIVRAIAKADRLLESEVDSFSTSNFTCEKPVIRYADGQITISCATEGAVIYYTTDGTSPETNGRPYSAPVPMNEPCKVRAIAKKTSYNTSASEFELKQTAKPVLSSDKNVDASVSIVHASTTTAGATVYYTFNETESTMEPTAQSQSADDNGRIEVHRNGILLVRAIKDQEIPSEVESMTIDWFYVATPSMVFSDGVLTISCTTPGATIYYEIGNPQPTRNSRKYTAPIALTDNQTVYAFAVAEGFNDSDVAHYDKANFTCEKPVFAYDGHHLTMTTATEGADIYYTINDDNVNTGSTRYTGPVDIATIGTVRAIAAKANTNTSAVAVFDIPAYYDGTQTKVATPGTLSQAFGWCTASEVEQVQLSGQLNEADLAFLRSMTNLQHLDMTNASTATGSLPDGAFANMTQLVSVSLPSSVTAVGGSLFSGCSQIAAITWNAGIKLTEQALQGIDNPNLLLYVNIASDAPSSVPNVVVGGKAANILLTDVASGNNNFYCPTPFTAQHISYTHRYTMQTGVRECRGWETIALPFTVQRITHATNGTAAPFGKATENEKPFWLCQLGDQGFERATAIEANTPYIIAMPNHPSYADEYWLSGNVTYEADNAEVLSSAQPVTATKGDFTFMPSFTLTKKTDRVLPINLGEAFGGYAEGSSFFRDLQRDVRPFEAYILSSDGHARLFAIEGEDSEVVSMYGMPTITGISSYGKAPVYDLSGKMVSAGYSVRLFKESGRKEVTDHHLRPGVYILRPQTAGQAPRKIVVK